jgi:outer membrane protein
MLTRLMALVLTALFFAAPAQAADFKLGTVDYSRAIQEIEEGKAAQQRLDTMYAGKRAELEQMELNLQSLMQEYQSKQAVLSDTAKMEYEQRLYNLQVEYQQGYTAAEMEMQQAYYGAMESLMVGLKETAETLGGEGGFDLILEVSQGSVLYAKSGVDMTDKVIQRYNSTH